MDKFKLIAFAIVTVFAVILIGSFLYLEATGGPTWTFLLFGSTILGNLAIFGALGYAQSKRASSSRRSRRRRTALCLSSARRTRG